MATESEAKIQPITRRAWLDLLLAHVEPEPEPLRRRRHRRYGLEWGEAKLVFFDETSDPPARIVRTVPILQASADGMMVLSHRPIGDGTALGMRCTLDDAVFGILGQVAHSTETVGGYKIGVKLVFAEDLPSAPAC